MSVPSPGPPCLFAGDLWRGNKAVAVTSQHVGAGLARERAARAALGLENAGKPEPYTCWPLCSPARPAPPSSPFYIAPIHSLYRKPPTARSCPKHQNWTRTEKQAANIQIPSQPNYRHPIHGGRLSSAHQRAKQRHTHAETKDARNKRYPPDHHHRRPEEHVGYGGHAVRLGRNLNPQGVHLYSTQQ